MLYRFSIMPPFCNFSILSGTEGVITLATGEYSNSAEIYWAIFHRIILNSAEGHMSDFKYFC